MTEREKINVSSFLLPLSPLLSSLPLPSLFPSLFPLFTFFLAFCTFHPLPTMDSVLAEAFLTRIFPLASQLGNILF